MNLLLAKRSKSS